ncbi:MAG: Glycosyl transferase group 1, partial [Parcubacteria group bacterium GW2011_GWA2_31_28]
MKILFIHNYYQYYGGEETYFHSLTKLLQQKGHEVITYTKDSKDIKTFWDKI